MLAKAVLLMDDLEVPPILPTSSNAFNILIETN